MRIERHASLSTWLEKVMRLPGGACCSTGVGSVAQAMSRKGPTKAARFRRVGLGLNCPRRSGYFLNIWNVDLGSIVHPEDCAAQRLVSRTNWRSRVAASVPFKESRHIASATR